jgi:DNA-binding IclR family transcriptional regulator
MHWGKSVPPPLQPEPIDTGSSGGAAASISTTVGGQMPRGVPRTMVNPFARALALLSVFAPAERGLTCRDLATRSGLPASTTARIADSLLRLGYLNYDPAGRRYRLAAAVLALGYGAIANSAIQQSARSHMRRLADAQKSHVILCTRDRLELTILQVCACASAPVPLTLHVGVRMGIASSPLGWALLATLPELERSYLLENIERKSPREWANLKRRLPSAIAQVRQRGYCSSLAEWDAELGTVAAAFLIEGDGPLVLACVGSGRHITGPRVARELGPRLLATASAIQSEGGGRWN